MLPKLPHHMQSLNGEQLRNHILSLLLLRHKTNDAMEWDHFPRQRFPDFE